MKITRDTYRKNSNFVSNPIVRKEVDQMERELTMLNRQMKQQKSAELLKQKKALEEDIAYKLHENRF